MANNYILSLMKENFSFTPTPCQDLAINKLCDFLNLHGESIFVLNGYAGTGKTTLVSALVKTLATIKHPVVLMAPTGRAAKVFSLFSGHQAFTVHKKIYRKKSSLDPYATFNLGVNNVPHTVFVVDEASMISDSVSDKSFFGSGSLLEDLIKYSFFADDCKLIFLGDTAQLPPVGYSRSKALDISELECFTREVYGAVLDDVVRQSEDSGILFNATIIRNLIVNSAFSFPVTPKFVLKNFGDIQRIDGGMLLEALESAYDKSGIDNTLVITRSNKNANIYNQGIRRSIFWREEEICVGDMLMVVKNNYFLAKEIETTDFIANGDIAQIVSIGKYEDLYGFRFANVELRFPDYNDVEIGVKILLDTLRSESPSLTQSESNRLFEAVCEDYSDLHSKKDIYQAVRDNKYYNALQVKFAYAVTCHKAQGGQWETVFIDQGYVTEQMRDIEYLRWLYTAFTRATKKLYLVNFSDDFFEK